MTSHGISDRISAREEKKYNDADALNEINAVFITPTLHTETEQEINHYTDTSEFKASLLRDGTSSCSEGHLLYGVFLFATDTDSRLENLFAHSPRRSQIQLSSYAEQLLRDGKFS